MIRHFLPRVGKSRNKLLSNVFNRDLHVSEFINIQWLTCMKNLYLPPGRTVAWKGGRR
jgi:hypothetical protein